MRKLIFGLIAVMLMGILSGCWGNTQATVDERNKVIGENSASGNYFEAKQISDIEKWKDDPNKIVNVYIINPVTGGLLVPPIQCKGVPASSTESLEPNAGISGNGTKWKVPLDGWDVYTEEMAGRDGTFGDPVPFRQCMSVDGNYYDFPALGLPYLVSSSSYTFPDATVKRDFEAEARLLIAEEVLKRGGCVDPETLVEIECKTK